jgi:hypothetical protein
MKPEADKLDELLAAAYRYILSDQWGRPREKRVAADANTLAGSASTANSSREVVYASTSGSIAR